MWTCSCRKLCRIVHKYTVWASKCTCCFHLLRTTPKGGTKMHQFLIQMDWYVKVCLKTRYITRMILVNMKDKWFNVMFCLMDLLHCGLLLVSANSIHHLELTQKRVLCGAKSFQVSGTWPTMVLVACLLRHMEKSDGYKEEHWVGCVWSWWCLGSWQNIWGCLRTVALFVNTGSVMFASCRLLKSWNLNLHAGF